MSSTVFSNVMILDGSGEPPFQGEVKVDGNRIAAISRDGAGVAKEGAEVIDGAGATLMPGLIESHGHPTFGDTASLEALGDIPPEEHTILAMKNAKKMLDQGFTALNSAAAAKPRLDVVLRNAIAAGDCPGPRMLAASPELTVTGGLGDVRLAHLHRETFAIVCDGADEFRRVSREMVREGVDTLKINPSGDEFVPVARAHQTVMNEAEIAAVCEVARSRDKRVAGHCRSAESVKLCVKHGVEIIYHATLCDEEATFGFGRGPRLGFCLPDPRHHPCNPLRGISLGYYHRDCDGHGHEARTRNRRRQYEGTEAPGRQGSSGR